MIANIENNTDARALLADVETLTESERKAKDARSYTEAVIESIPPFLVLDSDLRVQTTNESANIFTSPACMGGDMGCRAEIGKGSKFCIQLRKRSASHF